MSRSVIFIHEIMDVLCCAVFIHYACAGELIYDQMNYKIQIVIVAEAIEGDR